MGNQIALGVHVVNGTRACDPGMIQVDTPGRGYDLANLIVFKNVSGVINLTLAIRVSFDAITFPLGTYHFPEQCPFDPPTPFVKGG